MRHPWLSWGVAVVVFSIPVLGELVGGQPLQASDQGQTGTEASPAGPPTTPSTGLLHPSRDASGFAETPPQPPDPPEAVSTKNPFSPAGSEGWRELSGSLRMLAEALRSFPQSLETRLQLLQRASWVAYTTGRCRGWLEGGGVVAIVAIAGLVIFRRRSLAAKS